MNSLHAHLLLLAVCCVGYIASSPVIGQDQRGPVAGDSDADVLLAADEMGDNGGDNIDKRVERYAFGLGRRAYMYTNGGPGMKRLPVYNFGLGKRSRPYSFGKTGRGGLAPGRAFNLKKRFNCTQLIFRSFGGSALALALFYPPEGSVRRNLPHQLKLL